MSISSDKLNDVIHYLKTNETPTYYNLSQKNRFIKHYNKGYSVENDELFYQNKKVIPIEKINDILQEYYNNPSLTNNGRDKFYQRLTEKYYGIPIRTVQNFLNKQEVHQLHALKYKQKVVKPLIISKPSVYFQADLIEMENAKENNDTNYLLTIIDVFSKKAFVFALKTKNAEEIRDNFQTFLKLVKPSVQHQIPSVLQTDNGGEFVNDIIKELLIQHHIKHIKSRSYTAQSQGCIERFNRSLKQIIYQYLTQFNTKKYIDVLPKLVDNYNNRYHGTIKNTPNVAILSGNNKNLKKKILNNIKENAIKKTETDERLFPNNIEIGDYVRIFNGVLDTEYRKKEKSLPGANKKYKTQFGKDVYKIIKVINSKPNKQYNVELISP